MIHQLTYRSRATIEVSPLILASIGHIAEERNAAHGITGLLCHQDGSFFQVMEGPRAAIDMLMDIIALDHRHDQVEIISRRDLPEREFGSWAMAVVCDHEAEGEELIDRCFDKLADQPVYATAGFQGPMPDIAQHAD
ncbi:BLUF domain-containing protein [Novosphingopyxis baekryungensis]|uniref:BLUF domain-containing protein n=1 Tax=Novosphingopyxis baekryungensis TaxID=279369 RepID=UPI0003B3466E|nr:BLUF domain-containing protein [Novosphingopyxis baekryungensis]